LIFPPVVSQPHYGSPSSFVFSHLPAGLVCHPLPLVVLVVVVVLVDHHPLVLVPPRVLRKEGRHRKAAGAGLAELDFGRVDDRRGKGITLTACVSNPFGSECECEWVCGWWE